MAPAIAWKLHSWSHNMFSAYCCKDAVEHNLTRSLRTSHTAKQTVKSFKKILCFSNKLDKSQKIAKSVKAHDWAVLRKPHNGNKTKQNRYYIVKGPNRGTI